MFQWNEENTRQIVDLRDQGYSASQIGRMFGLTKGAVAGRLARFDGATKRRYSLDHDDMTPEEMRFRVWLRATQGARRTLAGMQGNTRVSPTINTSHQPTRSAGD